MKHQRVISPLSSEVLTSTENFHRCHRKEVDQQGCETATANFHVCKTEPYTYTDVCLGRALVCLNVKLPGVRHSQQASFLSCW